ncbi:hypothetical protein [Methylobacterium sp. WL12]|nr:hypothetical protein [Methylobacterium sp. WL12]
MRAVQDLSTTARDLALLRRLALDVVGRDEKKAPVHTKRRLAG